MNLLEQIEQLSDAEIWKVFSLSKSQLKERGLVRTNNITGERGEFLAVHKYNSTPGLSNLQAAPEGTQNVDALSRNGERYSIKTISQPGRTTGVFYGCGDKDSDTPIDRKFEFLIIVLLDKNLDLEMMVEMDWNHFLKFRKWHSTMKAWNITLTNKLLENVRIIK